MRTGQTPTFASHTASIAGIAHLRRPSLCVACRDGVRLAGAIPQKHVTAFSARARDFAEHRAPPAYFPDIAVRVGLANTIRARFRVHLAKSFTRHSFCTSAGRRLEHSSFGRNSSGFLRSPGYDTPSRSFTVDGLFVHRRGGGPSEANRPPEKQERAKRREIDEGLFSNWV